MVKRDLTIQCTVNDYKAPVRWFKGDVEIKVQYSSVFTRLTE